MDDANGVPTTEIASSIFDIDDTSVLSYSNEEKISRSTNRKSRRRKSRKKTRSAFRYPVLIIQGLIILLANVLVLLLFYPGVFAPDSIDSARMVFTNNYSDWSPILYTLLIKYLAIDSGNVIFLFIFQILAFSSASMFLLHRLSHSKLVSQRLLWATALVLAFWPPFWLNNVLASKDTFFTITLIYLTATLLPWFLAKKAELFSASDYVNLVISAFLVLVSDGKSWFLIGAILGVLLVIGILKHLALAKLVVSALIVVLGCLSFTFGTTYNFSVRSAPDAIKMSVPIQAIGAIYQADGDISGFANEQFSKIHDSQFWAEHYHPYFAENLTEQFNDVRLTPFSVGPVTDRIKFDSDFFGYYVETCVRNFITCLGAHLNLIKGYFVPMPNVSDSYIYPVISRVQDDLYINSFDGTLSRSTTMSDTDLLNVYIDQVYRFQNIERTGYSIMSFSNFIYQTNSEVLGWPSTQAVNSIMQTELVKNGLDWFFDNPVLYIYGFLTLFVLALAKRRNAAALLMLSVLFYLLALIYTLPSADFRYIYPILPILLVALVLIISNVPSSSNASPISEIELNQSSVDQDEELVVRDEIS